MLQLNITATVQFSQNFKGQNITAQKLVSVNASFSRITAVFSFKRFLEYEFLSILSSWLYINGNEVAASQFFAFHLFGFVYSVHI